MNIIFDIEANGFLDSVSKVHCLVLRDANTGEIIKSCADQPEYPSITEGLSLLEKASKLVGHNIDGYDLPVLAKLYGFKYHGPCDDTLVMARLAYPNLFEREILKTKEELGHKQGSHSLEAWGNRLGEAKIKFGNEEDEVEKTFEVWTPEMQVYCEQDTKVNHVLYQKLISKELSVQSLQIEHDFNRIIQEQIANGIQFDVEKAKELAAELKKDILKIERWSHENIQPTIIRLKTKEKAIPFNIGSTDQVADYFQTKYGWTSPLKTPTGKPRIDGDMLASLPFPEAKIFKDYHDRNKILGFINEGNKAWLKSVKDTGRIHGYVNPNGAITGRVKMSTPNLGQVPGSDAYKGKECRGLFIARPGYTLVDADASGLELRCLAHYMCKYDQGAYAREILTGDIHTMNMKAAGLESRNQAKTFIYAFLYGAGQEKLGSIVNPEASSMEKKAIGKSLKKKFFEAIPALQDLTFDIQNVFQVRGSLKGIDGRILIPREGYKAVNTLLQNAGAVAVKLANNIAYAELKKQGIDFHQVAFIHDEILLEVRPEQAKEAGDIIVQSIQKAGEMLNFKIPLTGEYKIGEDWSCVH